MTKGMSLYEGRPMFQWPAYGVVKAPVCNPWNGIHFVVSDHRVNTLKINGLIS
jgi:hypothetical protein